jgi:hypothetical protein
MGWGASHGTKRHGATSAPILMNDHGFSKIDQVFHQLDIHGWIVGAALDLFLAQKETHFATCTCG